MKKIKKKLLIILLIFIISIGFALLSSSLSINGISNILKNTWDIHFDNIIVKDDSVNNYSIGIVENDTRVNFSVELVLPGDFYEFTVDAINSGTIDGMIESFSLKLNNTPITTLPDYFDYYVTYFDGVEIENNHLLKANSRERYKVHVSYKSDIEPNQLPGSDQNLNLSFEVNYIQATNEAEEVRQRRTIYTVNSQKTYIDEYIYEEITQYDNPAAAMSAFGNRPFYLKHVVQGEIKESYVEFKISQEMANNNTGMTPGTYALRGIYTHSYGTHDDVSGSCLRQYYNTETGKCISPYYESNKSILISAFGENNCNQDFNSYYCYLDDIRAYAGMRGDVFVNDGVWDCDIYYDFNGESWCELLIYKD